MKIDFDVDIDMADRDKLLELIEHTPASIKRGVDYDKHNTGVYLQPIPMFPLEGFSTIDHKDAEATGYFKLDVLNNHIYSGVKSEKHLDELLATEPMWELFEHKEITKTYYAVTIGSQIPAGVIDDAIDDKPASSSFKVVKSLKSERFSFLNLVKLNPRSGRRHQLRKHLLSIGNPILGDAIYFLEGLQLKGKGLYLHAGTLEFIHPFTQEKMKIVTSLPKKFRKLFPEEGLLH